MLSTSSKYHQTTNDIVAQDESTCQIKKENKMEISREQLEKIVRERAAQMAKTMFNKKKTQLRKEIRAELYLVKGASAKFSSVAELPARHLQIYNIIKDLPNLDRHGILEAFQIKYGVELSTGTISGRISELQQSNLIKVSGTTIGKFMATTNVYSIVEAV